MKAKVSPTSPKVGNGNMTDLGNMYSSGMSEIEKPKPTKNQSQIWLLFVVVILGFFAGVISQLVLMSYGQNFPLLSKLGIFNGTTQIFTVSSQKNTPAAVATDNQLNQIVTQIAPTVVSIYKQSSQTGDLAGLLTDADRLGTGLVITEDGYLVTMKNIIGTNAKLQVATSQGKIFPVQTIIPDPASDFVFLKILGDALPVVPFGKLDSLLPLDQVVSLSMDSTTSQPVVNLDRIASVDFRAMNSLPDVIRSSDRYDRNMSLGGQYGDKDSRIIFGQNGEAIGIMQYADGRALVTPFEQIISVLDQLSGNKILRPVLGIRYVDLSANNTLSSSLTHDLTSGALIATDDEKNRPSVMAKSPAQKSGLQKGDIITAVDGQNVTSMVSVNSLILSKKPGDTLTVEYNRKNIDKELKIILTTS